MRVYSFRKSKSGLYPTNRAGHIDERFFFPPSRSCVLRRDLEVGFSPDVKVFIPQLLKAVPGTGWGQVFNDPVADVPQ
jgi:hypothetical protein